MNWHWLRTFARAYGGRGKAGLLFAVSLWLPLSSGCGAIAADNGAGSTGPWDGASPDGFIVGSPSDASSCHAGSVQAFVPNPYREAMPVPAACDPGQISGYFAACFGATATSAGCSAFASKVGNVTCASCIRSSDNAMRYGPLIGTGPLVRNNVAGCVELTEPSILSCAKTSQALSGCELAACAANCPVVSGDPGSLAAYSACAVAADADGCSMYTKAASCLTATDAAKAPYGDCLGSFQTFYAYAVPLFCGPNASTLPPEDAAAADSAPEEGGAGDAGQTEPTDGAEPDAGAIDGSPRPSDGAVSDARALDAAASDAARAVDAGFADATTGDAGFTPDAPDRPSGDGGEGDGTVGD